MKFKTKKSLGQNFLIDTNIINNIVSLGSIKNEDIVFENTDYFSLFGNLKFDSYSDSNFAKRGFYFNGDFHLYLNASGFNEDFEEFSIAKADIGYAFSLSDKMAVRIESRGGFTVGDKSTTSLNFALDESVFPYVVFGVVL